jgi:hypothetical protein
MVLGAAVGFGSRRLASIMVETLPEPTEPIMTHIPRRTVADSIPFGRTGGI